MTLYLIAINVYNSVKAPANRGFSYIEMWFIGVQIPILVAIFEYGILLAMRKYYKGNMIKVSSDMGNKHSKQRYNSNGFDMDSLAKMVDKWTFIGSLTFLLIFNIIYWSVSQFLN